ncbi:apolipoprotein N-acyltransferase [Mannheimia granulomatis]|uniref:apolipoprotein N-acyltransferase n=1 Tax=Mannheimia granulomatis TaxID=85402 RepID=UPI00159DFB4B|nr:apolipoprotein N-acyltransferase [Mannheimia granulomatis]QLB14472.1 apolipoprotein N-acyltransferase [Mannheimia granulomatis]
MNFVKNPPILTACLLALFLGASGTFAYSPFDIWPVAFISASGLIWAATLSNRKAALWSTLSWSIGYFCAGVSWVSVSMTQFGGVPTIVSYIAVFLLACYLALYNLLFSVISHKSKLTQPFALAAIFTFTEYLRGVVFTGFPWLQFGYSLIDSPFAGIAPILGVEGLTFLVMATGTYLVLLLKKEAKGVPTLMVLAVIFSLSFATRFINFVQIDKEKQPLVVSLVQGNIEQKIKWNPEHFSHSVNTYKQLITPLLGRSEVIVLPESAIPALENQITPILASLDKATTQSGSEVVIGTLYQNTEEELFNSAVLLGNVEKPYSLATENRYNKHHLVPFGEYVPFGSILDWMREVFILPINLSQGSFIQSPILAKSNRFNMAICYEIIFGDQVQQNQKSQNADYLLTITNDAWFGSSIGPWQHFQMARMRALELGKPLLRAANTGITAIVDANGKVVHQLPQFTADVLTATIHPTQSDTPFKQFGNWLIYGLSALCILVGFGFRRK